MSSPVDSRGDRRPAVDVGESAKMSLGKVMSTANGENYVRWHEIKVANERCVYLNLVGVSLSGSANKHTPC